MSGTCANSARGARLLALFSASLLAWPVATAGILSEHPDVLVCSVDDPTDVLPWDQLVFYVSAHIEAGTTLYKSLTSNPILITVDSAGRIDAPNLADCDGRTVAELRREGRAGDFRRH